MQFQQCGVDNQKKIKHILHIRKNIFYFAQHFQISINKNSIQNSNSIRFHGAFFELEMLDIFFIIWLLKTIIWTSNYFHGSFKDCDVFLLLYEKVLHKK